MKTFKTCRRNPAFVPLLGAALIGLLACGESLMGLEKPEYAVVEEDGPFELRHYEPYIVAETFVDADFGRAGNEGFRRLADYIFGNNRSRQKMEMTAPVTQSASEKIEMTAPVSTSRESDRYRITFMMPSEYTMETLPEPVDPEVELRQVPEQRMAAFRYSGRWSQSRYEDHLDELEGWIEARGLETAGEPILARYDPPWIPWFMRRNEVLIPLQDLTHRAQESDSG